MNSKSTRISLISLLVIGITVLHYQTGQSDITSHILFRELYLLPIILAGFWYGIYGGTVTAFSVTLLYLPFVLAQPEGISGHNFGNIIQIMVFNLFGVLFGWMRDRERKQQQKLREAENLAAMGRAVSCIAHDMKTPLTAIGGFVRQVRRRLDNERLAGKLDIAGAQVERLEALVKDMLAFARPLKLQYGQGRLDQLIEEVVMLAREKAATGHQVTIQTEWQGTLPAVHHDRHRLQQALLNLVNNAVEASPPGEKVVVRGQGQGEKIVIDIIDLGEGIPQERREEIFTPFVTSKKEGTGLGLAIVKKVVEAHGGSIEWFANRGKGVTFRLIIPVQAKVPGCDTARE
ncbi:MAG: ATP-binding protein [Thermodesulfobacteriota bacterium]